ncbi:NUDIX hydrolase [Phaeocystidibacter luteus]|uniref:NUDIX hydrolase n=1 Tax=Phaeocystidibacter luteus TaxID=911197 RepID=A0A6N6RLG7_9FLAO|nr:NUDIX hydrolase [Phaeocystidibacter luteus]KAB2814417.1 NUDIX hydrolase [Phaeocystidibacter luteus]
MNYCPNCGSDRLKRLIPEGDHRLREVCENCGTIHYSNPLMVVGCLVTLDGKVLLAKRGIEPRKGYWNLPCGFMENKETAEVGALREVEEETGLFVTIERLHSVFSVVHANQVYLIFKAEAAGDDFTLTPESTEIEFFEPDEIPWGEIAFSSNEHALRSYLDSPTSSTVHLGSYIRNI